MAVPGFSVSELIVAATQVKNLYDAFFSKHTSSAAQIRDLADDITLFRYNLRLHQQMIEDRGLSKDGYETIQRTLDQSVKFLQGYSALLDGRKFSAVVALKTTLYTYERNTVRRLQERIKSHYQTLHFSMTAMSFKDRSQHPITTTAPVTTNSVPDKSTGPAGPHLSFSDSPQLELEFRPPLIPRDPQLNGGSISPPPQAVSSIGPFDFGFGRQNSATSLTLPPPALPYVVATLWFDSKAVDLKRRALGRDFVKGRELVIVTENGSPRLKHQIKHPATQGCYPYTWHRRWKEHQLQVSFKGTPVKSHSININGQRQSLGPKAPLYVFTTHKDFVDFQSQVRGKVLVDYFDFGRIKTESSTRNGVATDQHLKIWRHGFTPEYSISFYASAETNAEDFEFPISMFNHNFESKDGSKVNLVFNIDMESKQAQATNSGRSEPLTTTASSVVSSDASIFSGTQTGLFVPPSRATTTTSRPSAGSFGSADGSPPQVDRLKNGLTVLEAQAKKMRYLSIEFWDNEEAFRFQRVFEGVYNEAIFRPSEFFENWRMDTDATAAGQARSPISNASVPGTPPFYMSPIMGSQKSPALGPQR